MRSSLARLSATFAVLFALSACACSQIRTGKVPRYRTESLGRRFVEFKILRVADDESIVPWTDLPIRCVMDLRASSRRDSAWRVVCETRTTREGVFSAWVPRGDGVFSVWCHVRAAWRLVDAWDVAQEWMQTPTGKGWSKGTLWLSGEFNYAIGLRVLDEEGGPIVGAMGSLVMLREGSPVPWRAPLYSDARGVIWLDGMALGGWWLDITKDGFVPERVAPGQGPEDRPDLQTLVLRRGRTLHGRVLDQHGSGISEALLTVQYGSGKPGPRGIWYTQTDAEGVFGLTVPIKETVTVTADATGIGNRCEPSNAVRVELRLDGW